MHRAFTRYIYLHRNTLKAIKNKPRNKNPTEVD